MQLRLVDYTELSDNREVFYLFLEFKVLLIELQLDDLFHRNAITADLPYAVMYFLLFGKRGN